LGNYEEFTLEFVNENQLRVLIHLLIVLASQVFKVFSYIGLIKTEPLKHVPNSKVDKRSGVDEPAQKAP